MHPCSVLLPTTPQTPSPLRGSPASHRLHFGFHKGVRKGFRVPVTDWPTGGDDDRTVGREELSEREAKSALDFPGFLFN